MANIKLKLKGWWKFSRARRWHYMVAGRSLCNGWTHFPKPDTAYELDDSHSADYCVICKAKWQHYNESKQEKLNG